MSSRAIFLAAAGLLAAGCGRPDPGPPLVPVAGQLLLGGEPLVGYDAGLIPDLPNPDAPPVAIVTDEQGRFQATTDGRPGAPVGSYRVVLAESLARPPARDRMPTAACVSPETSPLRLEVPAGGVTAAAVEVPAAVAAPVRKK